jgi:hypothetical protein
MKVLGVIRVGLEFKGFEALSDVGNFRKILNEHFEALI